MLTKASWGSNIVEVRYNFYCIGQHSTELVNLDNLLLYLITWKVCINDEKIDIDKLRDNSVGVAHS